MLTILTTVLLATALVGQATSTPMKASAAHMPTRGLLYKWPKTPSTRLSAPAATARTINVLDFGADPTGTNDSSSAIQKAVDAARALMINSTLGSAELTLDLQGGAYRLDKTVIVSALSGVVMGGGSLVAGPSFPTTSALLTCAGCTQIMFRDMVLDNKHRGGGIYFDAPLQVQINNLFFSHFATYGVICNSTNGHELLITNSFFEEYHWGEPGFDSIEGKTGTAIELYQPDSQIIDVIIRCAYRGIVSYSASNLIDSTHVYTTCNHEAQGANITSCFVLGGARVVNSYPDNCHMNLTSLNNDVVVMNNMFFGVSTLSLSPTESNAKVQGLRVTNNLFIHSETSVGQPAVVVDNSRGSLDYNNIYNVTIADNNNGRGTKARARGTFTSLSATVPFDLSAQLLFVPNDADIHASVILSPNCSQIFTVSTAILQGANNAPQFQVQVSADVTIYNCPGTVILSVS